MTEVRAETSDIVLFLFHVGYSLASGSSGTKPEGLSGQIKAIILISQIKRSHVWLSGQPAKHL